MLSLALAALIHFRDVSPSSWSFPDVTILASAGVLHGEASGLFAPTRPVSRQEAGATLARLLALPAAPSPAFHDASEVSPALRSDVARAAAAGILQGTAQGYLEPRQPLDRAAAAALLARAFKIAPAAADGTFSDQRSIPAYAQGDVAALADDGIVEGAIDGGFHPLRPVTRAEWAAMLLRAVAFSHGAAGAPSIVAGTIATTYPPDDANMEAESPLGGKAGAIGIAQRTLDLAPANLVYRAGAPADFFALRTGDLVAAFVGQGGTTPLVLDLAPAASAPATGKVADLTSQELYLDSGQVAAIGDGAYLNYQGRTLQVKAWPAYLLWAQVTVAQSPLTVAINGLYAFDLAGQVTAIGQGSFTLRLESASALAPLDPSLSAGDLVTVYLSESTTVAGLGANAPASLAVGLSAQVQGDVWLGGSTGADSIGADSVDLSQ